MVSHISFDVHISFPNQKLILNYRNFMNSEYVLYYMCEKCLPLIGSPGENL